MLLKILKEVKDIFEYVLLFLLALKVSVFLRNGFSRQFLVVTGSRNLNAGTGTSSSLEKLRIYL